MPSTPVTRSVIRSSSVPPRLPATRNPLLTGHRVTRTDVTAPLELPHQRAAAAAGGGIHVYGKVFSGDVHEPLVTVCLSVCLFVYLLILEVIDKINSTDILQSRLHSFISYYFIPSVFCTFDFSLADRLCTFFLILTYLVYSILFYYCYLGLAVTLLVASTNLLCAAPG